MAYGAGGNLVFITVAAIFRELSEANAELLGNLSYAFAGVVGAYIGFAVMDQSSKRRTEKVGKLSGADKLEAMQPAREGD